MKKFTVLALAALLVVVFTVPASAAVENIFGGYWRTRFYQNRNFDGDGAETLDHVRVDTRTRLYYTAKLNDNLKLVNKFEMDATWGDNSVPTATSTAGTTTLAGVTTSTYGDAGADGVAIEIKNSYADFNVGPVNFLVGVQPFYLARGFLSDDDNAGMKVIWKVNDGLYLPFIWNHGNDGDFQNSALSAYTSHKSRLDFDQYVFAPIVMLSKDIKISPYYVLLHARDGLYFKTANPVYGVGSFDNVNGHIFGVDFDGKFGAASVWFTGILQKGSATLNATKVEVDLEGYLVALGGKFDLGKADIHAQAFMATGEKDALTDKEFNAFIATGSASYYWAEIMGLGIMDNQANTGSPADKISNVRAINLGATFKPMDKLKVAVDLWYATLDEKNASGEKKLGTEADLVITYTLVEGLNLDIVGAYLWAGDAVSTNGTNDTNPYEFGTRLSLSF